MRNEYFAPLLQLEKKQIKHLSKKYLELKKEVNVVDEIGRGTFKPKSEEEWKLLLNRHGEKILDIPENFLSAEMLLIAMRSNSCGFCNVYHTFRQLNNQIFVIRVCRGICGLLCVNRMVIEQRRKALQIFTILEYLGK